MTFIAVWPLLIADDASLNAVGATFEIKSILLQAVQRMTGLACLPFCPFLDPYIMPWEISFASFEERATGRL
jgi:hypothetical protein